MLVPLAEQILGRAVAANVYHPVTNELILAEGELINEVELEKIVAAGFDNLMVRSVLTCIAEEGICASCYGRDLSTGSLVAVGEAIGVIAAQSIGEPGTQLTMRTFHIGGAAKQGAEISSIEALNDATIKVLNKNIVIDSEGKQMVMSRSCEVLLVDNKGNEKARHKIPYGARLLVDDNFEIVKGQKIAEWDPYAIPIITEKSGRVVFHDMVDNVSVREIVNDVTGIVIR